MLGQQAGQQQQQRGAGVGFAGQLRLPGPLQLAHPAALALLVQLAQPQPRGISRSGKL
jgi:hypothetical protein